MSLNHDYFVTMTVKQHHRELLAQAESDRLARRAARRPSWLRRLFGAAESPARPVPARPRPGPEGPEPVAGEPEASAEPATSCGATAHRVPVGAGRVSSI